MTGAIACVMAVSVFVGAVLLTAPLEQNEIAQALDAGEEFTTDLLSVDEIPTSPSTSVVAADDSDDSVVAGSDLVPRVGSPPPSVDSTPPTVAGTAAPTTAAPTTTPPTTAAPTTAAPTTTPPTTAPPAPVPVGQLGVVTSFEGLPTLAIPPTEAGFPLVAVGDSVMLGAAEELQARGFQVDALQSRQMNAFVPTMQTLREAGTFGSVVVVHLGTNGGFSDETLDAMLATLVDVPVVLLLTAKADRGWVAGNNAKLRAAPDRYENVAVIDWEVLSATCEGRCFYDDGIHLTQSGQDFYADMIGRVLAQP